MDWCVTGCGASQEVATYLSLFCNRHRNRLKLIFFDGSGLWVCAKRLERGNFYWPATGDVQGKVVRSHEELHLLIGGIDLAQTKARDWYREVTNEELPPPSV
jgi:transposase